LNGLSFQTPLGALVFIALVLPAGALMLFEQRARQVRRHLRLPEPQTRSHARRLALLCVLAGLLALAAAQPVLTRSSGRVVLTDAQAYAVFDTSESMLARQPGGQTRIARARQLAIRVRNELGDVPFGVATFAENALPHEFPSFDARAFAATVDDAVRIGQPPSPNVVPGALRATDVSSVSALNSPNYFSSTASHRLALVFSDDETSPFFPHIAAAALHGRTPLHVIFVHVWDARERIYLPDGRIDPRYTPDSSSLGTVDQLAALIGGQVVSEHDVGAIVRDARNDIGPGRRAAVASNRVQTPLARWLLLLALVPLAAILRVTDLYGSARDLVTACRSYALRRRRSPGSRLRARGLASLTSSRR
jgi:hypothetical protein